MNNIINIPKRFKKAVLVSDIADKIPPATILFQRIDLLHFELLMLIPRKHDQLVRPITAQYAFGHLLSKGTGPPCYERIFIIKHNSTSP